MKNLSILFASCLLLSAALASAGSDEYKKLLQSGKVYRAQVKGISADVQGNVRMDMVVHLGYSDKTVHANLPLCPTEVVGAHQCILALASNSTLPSYTGFGGRSGNGSYYHEFKIRVLQIGETNDFCISEGSI